MAQDITLPGKYDAFAESFAIHNGTRAKILVDVSPALVMPIAPSEVALPNEAEPRQIILRGGQRITDGLISSTDTVDRSLLLYVGQQACVYADMGTVSTVATAGAIVINRTVGSFIDDKLTLGCGVMLFGSTTYNNDGLNGQITVITASSITVQMAGTTVVSESQGASFRIFKLGLSQRIKLPANAGNSDTIPPVALVGYLGDARQDAGIFLGSESALIGAMAVSTSNLPVQVSVTMHVGMY